MGEGTLRIFPHGEKHSHTATLAVLHTFKVLSAALNFIAVDLAFGFMVASHAAVTLVVARRWCCPTCSFSPGASCA